MTRYSKSEETAKRRHSHYLLALKAVPVAFAVLVLRFSVHNTLNLQGIVTFSDAGAVITGATIIVGLMLAGVLTDYKESEKLPTVIGSALTALDSLAVSGLSVKDLDGSWVANRVSRVATAVQVWIHGELPDDAMWAEQADIAPLIVEVEKEGAPSHYVGRMLATNGDLSAALARVQTIRNTSFIRAGYVLMTLLVAIVLVLLVLIDFTSPIMKWIVPGVLALAYTYLILLVRDVDNPFSGAACVDLSPVDVAADTLADIAR